MPRNPRAKIKCKNPNCNKDFVGAITRLYCCKECAGEAYSLKKGESEYFDFDGVRMTKSQMSKRTGVPTFVISRRMKHFGASASDAARQDFKIRCKWCNEEFIPGPKCKSGFCSTGCSNRYCTEAEVYSERYCVGCGVIYKPAARAQDYCTKNCRQVNFHRKNLTTDDQYARISGNWKRYFQRLVGQKGRKGLTVDMLIEVAEVQEWKCALSGVEMQCYLKKGVKNPYNASIDRIEPGGPYSKENIRLTCAAVNKWRGDLDTDCFIEFCRSIADYNPREESI